MGDNDSNDSNKTTTNDASKTTTNDASFFSIEGDIKQKGLPFHLNRGSTDPQKFTYKHGDVSEHKRINGSKALLNFFPTLSKNKNFMYEWSLLSKGYDGKTSFKGYDDYMINEIINNLPGIHIREYLPSAKLDQLLNMFSDFSKGLKDGKSDIEVKLEEKKKELLKYWTKIKEATFIDKIVGLSNSKEMDIYTEEKWNNLILKLPHIFYYQFMAVTTTNYYDIPFNPTELYKSLGQSGWEQGGLIGLGQMTENSIVGKVMNYIGGNISINCSPIWKAGQKDSFGFEITFDLFNDTDEAAIANFIFVNTIIPNNMWIQYGMYQHNPDLYDIKIDGYNRLFMCSGNFTCNAKGVMRIPSNNIIKYLMKYKLIKSKFYNNFKQDIRIPDVYEMKLEFTSLLPNNFNNYLFNFIAGNNMDKFGPDGTNIYTDVKNAIFGELSSVM